MPQDPLRTRPMPPPHGPSARAPDSGGALRSGGVVAIGCGVGLLTGASALAQRLPLSTTAWLGLVALSAAGLAWSWQRRGPAQPDLPMAATETPQAPAPSSGPPPCVEAPAQGKDAVVVHAPDARAGDPTPVDDDREAMMYAVSHDLRAPIRVIEGFTRIVREDYGHALDRIGQDHLERVLGAAARMNGMIDSLLALSQLSTRPLERRTVDLSAMATDILEELSVPHPERVLEARVQPGLTVEGDPTLLRGLMENLLTNAWKYSARRDVTRIEFGVTREYGEVRFHVRDNGAGFDMRFAARLFGAFQRLHSASEYAGTGVGLASAQRVVRRHGGRIWAEAAVDVGATFFFTLPGSPA